MRIRLLILLPTPAYLRSDAAASLQVAAPYLQAKRAHGHCTNLELRLKVA